MAQQLVEKEEYEEILGKIEDVRLGGWEHGLMLDITVKFSYSMVQGFLFSLSEYSATKNRQVGTAAGLDAVIQILNLFEADELADIKGKTVYVLRKNGLIRGLRTPTFEGNKQFTLEEWAKEWKLK